MTTISRIFASLASLTLLFACENPPNGSDGTLAPVAGLQTDVSGDPDPDFIGPQKVGHSTMAVVHTGSAGERRPVDVHLWYPADIGEHSAASPTVYRSRLFGLSLVPGTYDPLAFEIPSAIAREGAGIALGGPQFPLLIWSHGSTNDALDYAFQGEALASHGFVVASIQHTGNTQDDVLINFINTLAGRTVLACLDELPRPCTDADAKTIVDRARDVSAVISELEHVNTARFANRIDFGRIGVIGQSRGGTTAIAAAAGSSILNIAVDRRVGAVMAMNGAPGPVAVFTPADLARVSIPVLMMAGGSDENQPPAILRPVFDMLSNTSRLFMLVRNADHRSFDSGLCSIMQAAGAVRLPNPRAILEDQTLRRLLGGGVSGSTLDYCPFDYFVDPVDIRPLVRTITGFDVTAANVPRAQSADEVSRLTVRLAVAFFDAALDQHGSDGLRFTRFLTPKYLTKHEPIVESAETVVVGDANCPEGQGCTDGR